MISGYTPLNDYRYERKFVSNTFDGGQVDVLIRRSPALFKNAFEARRVNNIYFDTPGLDCYFDNMFGVGNRWKARIRWYGDLFQEINTPILELKIKNGHLGKKESWVLNPLHLAGNLTDNRVIKDCIKNSDIPDDVKSRLLSMQPVLVNNYKRNYYVSANKTYRITVDTQLEYCDFRSFKKTTNQIFKERGKIVIELKYAKEFDSGAAAITNLFPFRLNKNSKFVSGMSFIRPGIAE